MPNDDKKPDDSRRPGESHRDWQARLWDEFWKQFNRTMEKLGIVPDTSPEATRRAEQVIDTLFAALKEIDDERTDDDNQDEEVTP